MSSLSGLLWSAALAAFAIAEPARAQDRRDVPAFTVHGEPESHAGAQQVRALIDDFRQAWGEQDIDRLIALHAEDVEWINAYARMFQDIGTLRAFLTERLFPAFDPAVSRQEADNMTPISIRYLGDDVAVMHLYTEGARGESRNAAEDLRRTHIHLVAERGKDGWRIVHEVIMDAR